ncbi:MAG: putative Ribbon-helix-helix protein [Actinobacteria bacterium]|nr:putative Ribbon-helix-helix protein [Actinomycetota bacterium]
MYDMKTSTVTIRMEPDLRRLLDKVCKQSDRTRSDVVRDSLKRQLSIIRFEQLRRQVLPFAEARGYLTDEGGGAHKPRLTQWRTRGIFRDS